MRLPNATYKGCRIAWMEISVFLEEASSRLRKMEIRGRAKEGVCEGGFGSWSKHKTLGVFSVRELRFVVCEKAVPEGKWTASRVDVSRWS